MGGKAHWYDPGQDVVLQIECNTERQTRVCGLRTLHLARARNTARNNSASFLCQAASC